jgi:hypothetical protein
MVEQDLDTYEREWRARLDAEDRALWYAVNSLYSTVWENSVQIDGFVQQLRSYRRLWIGYRAVAERLLSDNRPYVSQKLDKIDQYLIEQIRRFEQLRDNRRITEPPTRQPFPPLSPPQPHSSRRLTLRLRTGNLCLIGPAFTVDSFWEMLISQLSHVRIAA